MNMAVAITCPWYLTIGLTFQLNSTRQLEGVKRSSATSVTSEAITFISRHLQKSFMPYSTLWHLLAGGTSLWLKCLAQSSSTRGKHQNLKPTCWLLKGDVLWHSPAAGKYAEQALDST